MRSISQPNSPVRLGDVLISHLGDDRWDVFRAAVAFVKRSGVRHIEDALRGFLARPGVRATLSVGVDGCVTSVEGLGDLLRACGNTGEIFVVHNELESTFHPKLYLFRNQAAASVIVGSGNLTQGGLYTNYEFSVALDLDLRRGVDQTYLESVEEALDGWVDTASPTVRRLDDVLLAALQAQGYIRPERQSSRGDEPTGPRGARPSQTQRLFARVAVRRAPTRPRRGARPRQGGSVTESGSGAADGEFIMTLMQTDAGHGQLTKGTSRRSPEVFVPLGARAALPAFWGWPDLFQDAGKTVNRAGVLMWIGAQIVQVNMMAWKQKSDFRLRSEALRSAGRVGDLLRLSKRDAKETGYSYDVEIIPKNSPAFPSYLALCSNGVPGGSKKRWGYA